jgi:hypothetical protein
MDTTYKYRRNFFSTRNTRQAPGSSTRAKNALLCRFDEVQVLRVLVPVSGVASLTVLEKAAVVRTRLVLGEL